MLRPRCAGVIARHVLWRTKNLLRYQLRPGGDVYTFFWKLARPNQWRLPLLYRAAKLAGRIAQAIKWLLPAEDRAVASARKEPGISVVIPSRNGRELLEAGLPGVERELEGIPSEIIIVD